MTPFIKKRDIKKDWYIIDAENVAVGRLAAYISKVLRGKNKPTFNPHIDNGDFVVVTNIDIISKNVYIEDTDPNNISKKIDTSLRNITWTLNEPNLGMFGSYQQAQAMIDSRKISDFYKNFS